MRIKYPKVNVKPFVKACKVGLTKNAPTILTITGITAMASSTYWAVKATPKALALKEKAEVEKNKKAGTFKNQKLHYYDEKNEIKAWQYPPPDLVFSVGRAVVEEVAGLFL